MTSQENNDETITFFNKKNFFDYPKEKVKFFIQDKLPLIDTEGKIILDRKDRIKEASNGNGDVFRALGENGLVDEMDANGIKWVSIRRNRQCITQIGRFVIYWANGRK